MAIAAVAFTLYAALIDYINRPYVGPPLRAGETVRTVSRADAVTGSRIEIPDGRYTFVDYLYFAAPQDLEAVAYASLLATRDHAAGRKGINFVVVTAGPYPELETMRRNGAMKTPLVDDAHLSIARELKITAHKDAFLVIGPDGKVIFRPDSGIVASEDIRELAERFELGGIYYPADGPMLQSLLGTTMPDFPVEQVATRERTSLYRLLVGAKTQEVAIFAGGCPVCTLQAAFRRISAGQEAGRIIVFSSRFPRALLISMAKKAKVQAPYYRALSQLSGFENIYYAQASYLNTGVLVKLGAKRRILLAQEEQP